MAPAVTNDTESFWTGGANGQLLIQRCNACEYYMHPPFPVCRRCRSFDVSPASVSGRARVYSFTINRHPWTDPSEQPYVVAVVELVEQPELFITTNIVGCDVAVVHVDMEVEVDFVPKDDAFIPVFWPIADNAGCQA